MYSTNYMTCGGVYILQIASMYLFTSETQVSLFQKFFLDLAKVLNENSESFSRALCTL